MLLVTVKPGEKEGWLGTTEGNSKRTKKEEKLWLRVEGILEVCSARPLTLHKDTEKYRALVSCRDAHS